MSGATVGTSGLVFNEGLIFEQGSPGRKGYSLPEADVPAAEVERLIPRELLRDDLAGLPEVSEVEVVRHFTRLSQWNFGIDTGMYPLGSCTMKYNPRVHEDAVRLPGFAHVHPLTPDELAQGALQLMYELERYLAEILGMDRVTLHPSAGAHGELLSIMMIQAYHQSLGRPRHKILIPDSAHGTNPASAAICGFQVVPIKSGPRGVVEPAAVAEAMDEDVACIMITNPNTLGLFEEHLTEVARIVHAKGGQVYGDGANLNALLGIARPGDMGIDAIHTNLHKTFTQPHGGGGPGAGPVGVKAHLAPFLPVPVIAKQGDRYVLTEDRPRSVGKLRSFVASFGVMVRAYAYIRSLGAEGLLNVSRKAVLAANYLAARLKNRFDLPFPPPYAHEFILVPEFGESGVTELDLAKRLIDYGIHPPTMSWPIHHCLMIEPTETESLATLDRFVEVMLRIADEVETDAGLVKNAPHTTPVRRLDEVTASRKPNVRWRPR